MQTIHTLGALPDQLPTTVRQQPQRSTSIVGVHLRQIRRVQTDQRDRMRISVIVLAAIPTREHPHQRSTARRDIDHPFTRGDETFRDVLADTVATFNRPGSGPPLTTERPKFPEPLRVVHELSPTENLRAEFNTTTALIRLCGSTPITTLATAISFARC